jgi:rhodanese-related sulfurtransferase
MKISTIIFYCMIIFSFSFFNGCLKDKITPPVEVALSDSGKLLFYLEEDGDYINTADMPSLVDADEVQQNIGSYLILDIRPASQFVSGHIENAQNILHNELVSFLDSIDYLRYPKIIIVSKNGQSSSYYTCLLRLYGFQNVYSLSYGMAAWNADFSDEWFNALQQDGELLSSYSDSIIPKPGFKPLPVVSLTGSSLEESVKQRIKDMLAVDYEDNLGSYESTATIEYESLMGNPENFFIVCYNEGVLYKDIRDGIYHPQTTVLYHPPPSASDLSSATNLQTLPSDKKIAFYSTDGQLSAFAVAYLRVLGYDAKSVLFGANNMFYFILSQSSLGGETFSQSKIRNYSYVTGN